MGSHFSSLLDNSRKYKKEMGDEYVSVEHLLLAFHSDKRFGQQLFKNLQLSEKALKDAVQAVRGSQRVTDQSTNLYFKVSFFFSPRNIGAHDWSYLTTNYNKAENCYNLEINLKPNCCKSITILSLMG